VSDDDMKLPPGKTCGDCAHLRRCKALFGCKPTNTECDFSPSRFVARSEMPIQLLDLGARMRPNTNRHVVVQAGIVLASCTSPEAAAAAHRLLSMETR